MNHRVAVDAQGAAIQIVGGVLSVAADISPNIIARGNGVRATGQVDHGIAVSTNIARESSARKIDGARAAEIELGIEACGCSAAEIKGGV